ncbi:MAG: hypothetical protein R3C68_11655 [Myxococcota bacterium]
MSAWLDGANGVLSPPLDLQLPAGEGSFDLTLEVTHANAGSTASFLVPLTLTGDITEPVSPCRISSDRRSVAPGRG